MPAGYSKRSLVEKLGVKADSRVAFVDAPEGYDQTLGPLPSGIRLLRKPAEEMDFIQAFFTDAARLSRSLPGLKSALKKTGVLWLSWPKKASKMKTDLTETEVRQLGLQHGLVDVKVCAVDDVWSGLKFMYRLKDR